jgi:hypothetical protein
MAKKKTVRRTKTRAQTAKSGPAKSRKAPAPKAARRPTGAGPQGSDLVARPQRAVRSAFMARLGRGR